MSTIAGNGNPNRQGVKATATQMGGLDLAFSSPWDVCYDGENGLFVALAGNHQICKFNLTDHSIELVAGTGKEENRNNSYPLKASFAQPSGLCLSANDLYIADSESSSIRVFNLGSGVKNVCGGSRDPLDLFSYGDKDGKGQEAKLQHPLGVAFVQDKLFLLDSYNHKLKVVKDLKAKAPECVTCPVNGLDEPGGLCFDGKDSLYVADTNNHRIKLIHVESFEVAELVLEMPKASDEEVDFSKASLVIKAKKGSSLQVRLKLDPDFHLNPIAPNSFKVDFPLGQGQKGAIGKNLEIKVENIDHKVDFLTCNFKLYLCSNSNNVCTVRNKKVIFQFDADISGDNEVFVIDC